MARARLPLQVFNDYARAGANARVYVTNRRTGLPAAVYTTEDGSTPLAQPLVCDARGFPPGWVERGAFVALVGGANITGYTEEFDVLPASNGGLDGAAVADASVSTAKLADRAVTRPKLEPAALALGDVFLWWVPPTAPHTAPDGCELADGRTLVAGQHDFPVAGSITLPNLLGRTFIGADVAKAWGTASSPMPEGTPPSESPRYAPGVGGIGGDNARRDLRHAHTFEHSHNVQGIDHLHGVGSLYVPDHAHGIGGDGFHGHSIAGSNLGTRGYASGATQAAYLQNTSPATAPIDGNGYHSHGGTTWGTGWLGLGGATGPTDRSLNTFTTSQSSTTTSTNGTAALDVRAAHVGLVPFVRVRNA